MRTADEPPTLVARFQNDEVGVCANVRELPEFYDFEVSVVDAFSGDVVVSRIFNNREVALKIAEAWVEIQGPSLRTSYSLAD